MQKIKCIVSVDTEERETLDLLAGGSLTWSLGTVTQSNKPVSLDNADEDSVTDEFEYVPKVEDDGKDLVCRFTPKNAEAKEALLGLKIHKAIFPQSPVKVEKSETDPFKITLDLELYPEPEDNQLIWVIEQVDDDLIELRPSTRILSFLFYSIIFILLQFCR